LENNRPFAALVVDEQRHEVASVWPLPGGSQPQPSLAPIRISSRCGTSGFGQRARASPAMLRSTASGRRACGRWTITGVPAQGTGLPCVVIAVECRVSRSVCTRAVARIFSRARGCGVPAGGTSSVDTTSPWSVLSRRLARRPGDHVASSVAAPPQLCRARSPNRARTSITSTSASATRRPLHQ